MDETRHFYRLRVFGWHSQRASLSKALTNNYDIMPILNIVSLLILHDTVLYWSQMMATVASSDQLEASFSP